MIDWKPPRAEILIEIKDRFYGYYATVTNLSDPVGRVFVYRSRTIDGITAKVTDRSFKLQEAWKTFLDWYSE